jgi:hypothetical protein
VTFMTAKTQDQSIDLGAFVTDWVQAAGEYVGLSQTFRLTTGAAARPVNSSTFTDSTLTPFAAASLARGHRSAPRFSLLDADRCSLVTREHR